MFVENGTPSNTDVVLTGLQILKCLDGGYINLIFDFCTPHSNRFILGFKLMIAMPQDTSVASRFPKMPTRIPLAMASYHYSGGKKRH